MPLTTGAREIARYLLDAWNNKVIDSQFELIDASADGDKAVETTPGSGVLKVGAFQTPPLAELWELAANNLIAMNEQITGSEGRKWTIRLTSRMREAADRVFSETSQPPSITISPLPLPRIFVSYKRHDRAFADRLIRRLRRIYGADHVWFDEGMFAGRDWWDEIISQIRDRDILLYLLSQQSLESVYCRAEVSEAWRFGKQVIAAKIAECTVLEDISRYHYIPVDFDDGDTTVDSFVEILAGITRQVADSPLITPESLWMKRALRPVRDRGIRITLDVPAAIEPRLNQRELCNTGILVVSGDEILISTTGKITVDDGLTWKDPNGYHMDTDTGLPIIHFSPDAFRAAGHPQPGFGDRGVVGSLFGWIGGDRKNIEEAFFIGKHQRIIVDDREGFLYLAVNDIRGEYSDNQGAFNVTIEIRHPASE